MSLMPMTIDYENIPPGPESVILSSFFHSLFNDEVPYCVLRNYDSLPDHVPGSDVDLLVPAEYLDKVIEILLQCVQTAGWDVQQTFEKNYRILHYRLVRLGAGEQPVFLLVDLMTDIGLGPIRLIEGKQVVQDRRLVGTVWAPAPVMEQQINILNAVYTGIPMKQRYRKAIPSEMEECLKLRESLATYLGDLLAGRVIEGISSENEFLLKKDVRRALWLHAMRQNLVCVLKDCTHYLRVQYTRILSPPGIMVVFLGPDGIGKSTIVTTVCERLRKVFPGVTTQHLRPHLIPALGDITGKTEQPNNTENAIKNKGFEKKATFWRSFIRIIYYAVDYTVGYWVRIRPSLARGKLLLFDRYYYDYHVDYLQKGVNLPDWLVRLICGLFPSPQKVFVLSAKAEIVRQRRDDLDEEEIERQVQGYIDLRNRYKNVHVIDASGPVNEISNEIIRLMFKSKN